MSAENKAVEESSKMIAKFGGFIAALINGPLEQAVGIWEDKLRYRRWENQLDLMDRAKQELERRGLPAPTRSIPLQFAVPLLEAASLEEDDYLRQFWVTMLVNAADESVEFQMRRAFISILEDLTSLDAQILDTVYRADAGWPGSGVFGQGFHVAYLPMKAQFPGDFEAMPRVEEKVAVSVGNLMRLGLLSETESVDGGRERYSVSKTDLGNAFHLACGPERHYS